MTDDDNPFRQCLASGHFAVTAELTPPRDADFDALEEAARILSPVVSAINLTDGAGARVRMCSLAAAIRLRQLGAVPILQMTCRDRNRIALKSDLLGAAAFGIHNLLVLTGDSAAAGDEPAAAEVFDFDTVALLSAASGTCTSGTAAADSVLSRAPRLFCGAADRPRNVAADWTPDALLAKHAAGARFVQTQYCFDMALLERYMQRLRECRVTDRLYFLIGLGPLRSAAGARWMRDNLHGAVVPDGVVRRLEAARDPYHEGIAICAELIEQAREIDGVAGVHLMGPEHPQAMVEAVRLAGML